MPVRLARRGHVLRSVTGGGTCLGYIWNNNSATYGWNSGIFPPANQWSMVALTVTPSNGAITLINSSGLQTSSNPVTNPIQAFSGVSLIGDDGAYAAGARTFNGIIDEVSVYNTNLSRAS